MSNSTSRKWRDEGSPAPTDRPDEDEIIGYRSNGDAIVSYQSYTPRLGNKGNVEAMPLWAGQGVSLVGSIMPAAEIVYEIYREAKQVIQSRQSIL